MSTDVVRCAVCDNQMFASTPACVVCGTPNPFAGLATSQPAQEQTPAPAPQMQARTDVAASTAAQDTDTAFTFDFAAFTTEAPSQPAAPASQADTFALDLSSLFAWDDTPAAPPTQPEATADVAADNESAYFASGHMEPPIEDAHAKPEMQALNIVEDSAEADNLTENITESVPSLVAEVAEPLAAANSKIYAPPTHAETTSTEQSWEQDQAYSPVEAPVIEAVPVETEPQLVETQEPEDVYLSLPTSTSTSIEPGIEQPQQLPEVEYAREEEPAETPQSEEQAHDAAVELLAVEYEAAIPVEQEQIQERQEEQEIEAAVQGKQNYSESEVENEAAQLHVEAPIEPDAVISAAPVPASIETAAPQNYIAEDTTLASLEEPLAHLQMPAVQDEQDAPAVVEPEPSSEEAVNAEQPSPAEDSIAFAAAVDEQMPPAEAEAEDAQAAPAEEITQGIEEAPLPEIFADLSVGGSVEMPAPLESEASDSHEVEQSVHSGPPTTPLGGYVPPAEDERSVEEPEQATLFELAAAETVPSIEGEQAEERVVRAQTAGELEISEKDDAVPVQEAETDRVSDIPPSIAEPFAVEVAPVLNVEQAEEAAQPIEALADSDEDVTAPSLSEAKISQADEAQTWVAQPFTGQAQIEVAPELLQAEPVADPANEQQAEPVEMVHDSAELEAEPQVISPEYVGAEPEAAWLEAPTEAFSEAHLEEIAEGEGEEPAEHVEEAATEHALPEPASAPVEAVSPDIYPAEVVAEEPLLAVEAVVEPPPAIAAQGYGPDSTPYIEINETEQQEIEAPTATELESQFTAPSPDIELAESETAQYADLVPADGQEQVVAVEPFSYAATFSYEEQTEQPTIYTPEPEEQAPSAEIIEAAPMEAAPSVVSAAFEQVEAQWEPASYAQEAPQEPEPVEETAASPEVWQIETYSIPSVSTVNANEPAPSLFDDFAWSPDMYVVPPATPEAEIAPVAESVAYTQTEDSSQPQVAEPVYVPTYQEPVTPQPQPPVAQIIPPTFEPEVPQDVEPYIPEPAPTPAPFYVQTVTSPSHSETGTTQANQDGSVANLYAWNPGDALPEQEVEPPPPQDQIANGTLYYSQTVQPMSSQQGQGAPASQGFVQPSAFGPASTWDPSRPRPKPGTPEYDEMARQAFAARAGNPQPAQGQYRQSQQTQQTQPQQTQPQPSYNPYQQSADNQTGPLPGMPKPQPGTPEYDEMARQAFAHRGAHPGAATPQTGPLPLQPQPQPPAAPGLDPNAPRPKPGTPEYEALVRQALSQKLNKRG